MAEPDPGMELVARHLAARGGPPLADYKDRCLRRRLAVRMRACGAASLADYATLLADSTEETARLLEALTINVTQFFRNPEVWDRLASMLEPRISGDANLFRAWSAGCASGEEAYSVALLVAAHARSPLAGRLRVDATDIDVASLERARVARYPARAVLGSHPLAAGLVAHRDVVELPAELRAPVHFAHGDLLRAVAPDPPYDLILCRNVIIYFEREAQERLFDCFTQALHPGGLLVLGRVETVSGAARDRLELVHSRERIYRRRV